MSTCNQCTTHHACDCILERLRRADVMAHAAKKLLRQSFAWKKLGAHYELLQDAVEEYEKLL